MSCPEYLRLRQHYLAALRRWGQTEAMGAAKPEIAEIKEKALNERNAANERMRLHELSCPVCNHKRKPHSSK